MCEPTFVVHWDLSAETCSIIIYGARFSRIPHRWHTWFFICCDIFSILVQAYVVSFFKITHCFCVLLIPTQQAGGVIASQSTTPSVGNDVMMVGLVSQVVTLAIFGLMAVDVFLRIRKFRGEFNESTNALRHSARFRYFLVGFAIAYITILSAADIGLRKCQAGGVIRLGRMGLFLLCSMESVSVSRSPQIYSPKLMIENQECVSSQYIP